MKHLTFTPDQQTAITDHGGDLLVSAAAGSGKTRVLVERLLEQIEAGANLSEFLIITFTRDAAAELKGRILQEITRREGVSPSRHLRRQSALVYNADIGTIHAFCGKLVREYAHVLGQSPDFATADEHEAKLLLGQVLEDTLEARYAAIEDYPGFSDLADMVSTGRRDQVLLDTVLDVYHKLRSHPYPDQWAAERLAELTTTGLIDAGETPWGAYLLDGAAHAADYWLREMAAAKEEFLGDSIFDKAYGPSWDETLGGLARFVVAAKKGWDEATAASEIPFPRPKPVSGSEYDAYKDLRRRCKSAMDKLTAGFGLSSADLFEDIAAVRPALTALIALVQDLDRAYQKEKARRGLLDFSDLEHLAVRLLVDPDTAAPTRTAMELAPRYREIMVDEFQDVAGIQDIIFRALSECGPRRFLVGDVKQSIYRFRLADPSIFLGYYRRFPLAEDAPEGQGRKVLLGKNFRSRPGVLEAVNFLFRRIMSVPFGEMAYGDDEALYPGLAEAPTDTPAVELDILDTQHLTKDGTDEKEMASARHVAARIRVMHEQEGYAWGDFAILFRATTKVGQYEKALEEVGIPVAKSGGGHFFYTPAVATLVSLLTVILNPLEDVHLIGLLRSPLFGFTPDELAQIRLRDRGTSFFEALELAAGTCDKCARFIQTLTRYRDEAADMPIDRFLWYLVQDTGAMGIFGAQTDGEIALQNIHALLNYAGAANQRGYRSLFDFVTLLEKRIEHGDALSVPSPQGAADAVTILTVHKSKGLEFPVVVLPELSKSFNFRDKSGQILVHPILGLGTMRRDLERKISYSTLARNAIARKLEQEMKAEELRVLYVAMTRAEARLILVAECKDTEATLDKLAIGAENPVSPYVLETENSWAKWILLAGLSSANPPWQVNQIVCQPGVTSGIYAENIPQPHTLPAHRTEPPAAFIRQMEYAYPHPEAIDLPSKLTATALKGRTLDREASEDAEGYQTPKRVPIFRRPGFVEADRPLTPAERGTATHLVMQYIDFQRCTSFAEIQTEIARLTKAGHITPHAAHAVDPEMIWQFFQSPLGQRVLTATHLRREFKFSLLAPAAALLPGAGGEEILLQGVIDCYLEEPDGIIVLDFKTDHVPAGGISAKAEEYKGQMQAYAYALERITAMPVKERVLYFFAVGEGVSV
ncbi:MAG: exodeoxyribonuclease V subunit beta [Oscillospiraceae bacterium]|nr:exodeoxyribonuclease V subunit beta [Oscillospiraceae bacterium]